MLDLTIKIPAINLEHKVPKNQAPWKAQAISIMKNVKKNYLKQLTDASNYTGVPLPIILAFTATESFGDKNENLNRSAKGIMQIELGTAYTTLKNQLKEDTIGEFITIYKLAPLLFEVKRTIPSDFRLFGDTKSGNLQNNPASYYLELKPLSKTLFSYLKDYLLEPDAKFISYVGAMCLAQLINKTIKRVGQIRLDHVIIKYNAGTGSFARNITNKGLENPNVDTLAIFDSIQKNFDPRKREVTREYLIKMLGVNGFMDIQKQKLA